MRNSRAAGVRTHCLTCVDTIINELESYHDLFDRQLRALPMALGVIAALPVNHRVGLSLKSLILKIRSYVNDRGSLWGMLISSMIRLRLNVTIAETAVTQQLCLHSPNLFCCHYAVWYSHFTFTPSFLSPHFDGSGLKEPSEKRCTCTGCSTKYMYSIFKHFHPHLVCPFTLTTAPYKPEILAKNTRSKHLSR